jgi:hypothetical protein
MSIPLDRLYHYIESIAQAIRKDNVVIYRFYPYGSKKTIDLSRLSLYNTKEMLLNPHIYCNDQEPLNYKFYSESSGLSPELKLLYEKNNFNLSIDLNFRDGMANIYNQAILLHSEKRSKNLESYKNNHWITVYYWSHAVIARDWFRYAEHIKPKKNIQKTFLIYNRAWSGTREYRLGFADQLIIKDLVDHVIMRVSPIDSTLDKHYDLHHFELPHWRPHNVIEKHFPLCTAESYYSADFDIKDYESTDIEIVLETLFDDLRLHLTEKTLRPIAMGQPFLLAGTYGSLNYLRGYGFKTFGNCWDESYDMITDSVDRMNKIIEVMKNIVSMPMVKRKEMLTTAQAIADYNKKHFFSNKFQTRVLNELKENLQQAFIILEKTNTSTRFLNWYKKLANYPEIKNNLRFKDRQELANTIIKARQYYLRTLSKD